MKNIKYTHIKKTERLEIAILLNKGYSRRDIARTIKRSASSISEEINNNSVNGIYDPNKAHHKAYVKRKYSKYQGMKVVSNVNLWNYILDKMRQDWSPENISGRIKEIDCHIKQISAKGIYKFIYSVYGRNLEQYLTYKGKKKKPKISQKVSEIKDRVFINKRPKIVDKRRGFGDWEGDFIVSGKNGKGVLLTLYERKAKYSIIRKLPAKEIELVHQIIHQLTGGYIINSLTLDNDIVFRKHKQLSELLSCPIYFCHPYHSWEKGGVENINKLIRRYIPKGSDISQYSEECVKFIEDKLNNRPRKCLNFKTPKEIMEENHQLRNEIKFVLHDILKVEETKKAECSA